MKLLVSDNSVSVLSSFTLCHCHLEMIASLFVFTAVKLVAVLGHIFSFPEIVTSGIGFAIIDISAEDLQTKFSPFSLYSLAPITTNVDVLSMVGCIVLQLPVQSVIC